MLRVIRVIRVIRVGFQMAGLACLLLSIGQWSSVPSVWPKPSSISAETTKPATIFYDVVFKASFELDDVLKAAASRYRSLIVGNAPVVSSAYSVNLVVSNRSSPLNPGVRRNFGDR